MSRVVSRAPLAVTSDGTVLINVAMFDVAKRLDLLLAVARGERGAVFIGVVLRPGEIEALQQRLAHAERDAAAWIVGARQQTRKRRRVGSSTARRTRSG